MEDQALVREALLGSQEAYREIVVRYQNVLFGLILRMVRNRSLAEDLVQESFVKAFRALASYDQRRKLSSWLFKIAHNTTIDHLRRGKLATVPLEVGSDQDRLGPVDRVEDPSLPDPERGAISRRLGRALGEAMASLEPLYRELILLRFQEGLAYHEIADVLDLPIGTVKTRIHRGRKRLVASLEAGGWGPSDDGETDFDGPS